MNGFSQSTKNARGLMAWSSLMNCELDVSVIIATFNRAEILRQTLESMTHMHRDGLLVEFVIVDNNSSDNTREVIDSYRERLPIRYLFEAKSGQNCARNAALRNVDLGKIVAFTDDDVEPRRDWLQAIVTVAERWPDYSVFGGRIYPIWPDADIPECVHIPWISSFAFGKHDYGDKEKPYPLNALPFSANLWVRREVFANNRRFCEMIGPRPGQYIMGSETHLLRQLSKDGYDMIYSPTAVAGHRIQPEQLNGTSIRRRAYRFGRGIAHLQSLRRPALLAKHPVVWSVVSLVLIAKHALVFLLAMLLPTRSHRFQVTASAIKSIAYNIEALQIARNTKTK